MDRETAAVLFQAYRAWAASFGVDADAFHRRVWQAITLMQVSGQEIEHWVDAAAFVIDMERGAHAVH